MTEPFDEYIDSFTLGAGPYGISFNFLKSSPKPSAPGSIPVSEEIGTIRMSLEHFKLMAFLLRRQAIELEEQLAITIPVSTRLLNQLKIAPEDWESFWNTSTA